MSTSFKQRFKQLGDGIAEIHRRVAALEKSGGFGEGGFGGSEHENIGFLGDVEVEGGTLIVEIDGQRLKLVRDSSGAPAFESL